MDNQTTTEQSETALRLAKMPDGVYRLTRDVPNPVRDRRRRWGTGLNSAADVLSTDTLWVLNRYPQEHGWVEVLFRAKDGNGTQVGFLMRDGYARPITGADNGPAARVMLDVVNALAPVERRTFDTVQAAATVHGYGSGWGALEQLFTTGKITLDDIEVAVAAWRMEDAPLPRA